MTVLSPFLLNTNIQYAWVKQKADWLVANSININGCLVSHLRPNAKGYIPISFGREVKQRAHRIVYFASNPEHDQNQMVLHKCDNRACINVNHLFLGTAQDNTNDMISKGRKIDDPLVGERRRQETWKRIKPLYEQGLSRDEIAKRLHLSGNTVWNYISEKGSSYLGGNFTISSGN
jgi:DNA-binding NarL/FixJ family response regulator